MKYAVLEWNKEDVDGEYADVIATNQDLKTSEWLINIAPEHLHREMINMSEYEVIKKG